MTRWTPALAALVALATLPAPAAAQHEDHGGTDEGMPHAAHDMWAAELGGGWRLLGMAQAFPMVTRGAGAGDGPFDEAGVYLTQPAVMAMPRPKTR